MDFYWKRGIIIIKMSPFLSPPNVRKFCSRSFGCYVYFVRKWNVRQIGKRKDLFDLDYMQDVFCQSLFQMLICVLIYVIYKSLCGIYMLNHLNVGDLILIMYLQWRYVCCYYFFALIPAYSLFKYKQRLYCSLMK